MNKKYNAVILFLIFSLTIHVTSHLLHLLLLYFFQIVESLLLLVICIVSKVSGAPAYHEPTDLQSKFVSINGGMDYRTLFFTEGWNKDTLEIDFETLVNQGVNKIQSSCPSTFLKGNGPLMVRNSCPWYLEKTEPDNTTYPQQLYTAKSKCQKCIGSDGEQKCERIQYKLKTLKKGSCQDGTFVYEPVDTYVTIAFVCAQPREVENSILVSTTAVTNGPPTM